MLYRMPHTLCISPRDRLDGKEQIFCFCFFIDKILCVEMQSLSDQADPKVSAFVYLMHNCSNSLSVNEGFRIVKMMWVSATHPP